jgi:hypothetical protein
MEVKFVCITKIKKTVENAVGALFVSIASINQPVGNAVGVLCVSIKTKINL